MAVLVCEVGLLVNVDGAMRRSLPRVYTCSADAWTVLIHDPDLLS